MPSPSHTRDPGLSHSEELEEASEELRQSPQFGYSFGYSPLHAKGVSWIHNKRPTPTKGGASGMSIGMLYQPTPGLITSSADAVSQQQAMHLVSESSGIVSHPSNSTFQTAAKSGLLRLTVSSLSDGPVVSSNGPTLTNNGLAPDGTRKYVQSPSARMARIDSFGTIPGEDDTLIEKNAIVYEDIETTLDTHNDTNIMHGMEHYQQLDIEGHHHQPGIQPPPCYDSLSIRPVPNVYSTRAPISISTPPFFAGSAMAAARTITKPSIAGSSTITKPVLCPNRSSVACGLKIDSETTLPVVARDLMSREPMPDFSHQEAGHLKSQVFRETLARENNADEIAMEGVLFENVVQPASFMKHLKEDKILTGTSKKSGSHLVVSSPQLAKALGSSPQVGMASSPQLVSTVGSSPRLQTASSLQGSSTQLQGSNSQQTQGASTSQSANPAYVPKITPFTMSPRFIGGARALSARSTIGQQRILGSPGSPIGGKRSPRVTSAAMGTAASNLISPVALTISPRRFPSGTNLNSNMTNLSGNLASPSKVNINGSTSSPSKTSSSEASNVQNSHSRSKRENPFRVNPFTVDFIHATKNQVGGTQRSLRRPVVDQQSGTPPVLDQIPSKETICTELSSKITCIDHGDVSPIFLHRPTGGDPLMPSLRDDEAAVPSDQRDSITVHDHRQPRDGSSTNNTHNKIENHTVLHGDTLLESGATYDSNVQSPSDALDAVLMNGNGIMKMGSLSKIESPNGMPRIPSISDDLASSQEQDPRRHESNTICPLKRVVGESDDRDHMSSTLESSCSSVIQANSSSCSSSFPANSFSKLQRKHQKEGTDSRCRAEGSVLLFSPPSDNRDDVQQHVGLNEGHGVHITLPTPLEEFARLEEVPETSEQGANETPQESPCDDVQEETPCDEPQQDDPRQDDSTPEDRALDHVLRDNSQDQTQQYHSVHSLVSGDFQSAGRLNWSVLSPIVEVPSTEDSPLRVRAASCAVENLKASENAKFVDSYQRKRQRQASSSEKLPSLEHLSEQPLIEQPPPKQARHIDSSRVKIEKQILNSYFKGRTSQEEPEQDESQEEKSQEDREAKSDEEKSQEKCKSQEEGSDDGSIVFEEVDSSKRLCTRSKNVLLESLRDGNVISNDSLRAKTRRSEASDAGCDQNNCRNKERQSENQNQASSAVASNNKPTTGSNKPASSKATQVQQNGQMQHETFVSSTRKLAESPANGVFEGDNATRADGTPDDTGVLPIDENETSPNESVDVTPVDGTPCDEEISGDQKCSNPSVTETTGSIGTVNQVQTSIGAKLGFMSSPLGRIPEDEELFLSTEVHSSSIHSLQGARILQETEVKLLRDEKTALIASCNDLVNEVERYRHNYCLVQQQTEELRAENERLRKIQSSFQENRQSSFQKDGDWNVSSVYEEGEWNVSLEPSSKTSSKEPNNLLAADDVKANEIGSVDDKITHHDEKVETEGDRLSSPQAPESEKLVERPVSPLKEVIKMANVNDGITMEDSSQLMDSQIQTETVTKIDSPTESSECQLPSEKGKESECVTSNESDIVMSKRKQDSHSSCKDSSNSFSIAGSTSGLNQSKDSNASVAKSSSEPRQLCKHESPGRDDSSRTNDSAHRRCAVKSDLRRGASKEDDSWNEDSCFWKQKSPKEKSSENDSVSGDSSKDSSMPEACIAFENVEERNSNGSLSWKIDAEIEASIAVDVEPSPAVQPEPNVEPLQQSNFAESQVESKMGSQIGLPESVMESEVESKVGIPESILSNDASSITANVQETNADTDTIAQAISTEVGEALSKNSSEALNATHYEKETEEALNESRFSLKDVLTGDDKFQEDIFDHDSELDRQKVLAQENLDGKEVQFHSGRKPCGTADINGLPMEDAIMICDLSEEEEQLVNERQKKTRKATTKRQSIRSRVTSASNRVNANRIFATWVSTSPDGISNDTNATGNSASNSAGICGNQAEASNRIGTKAPGRSSNPIGTQAQGRSRNPISTQAEATNRKISIPLSADAKIGSPQLSPTTLDSSTQGNGLWTNTRCASSSKASVSTGSDGIKISKSGSGRSGNQGRSIEETTQISNESSIRVKGGRPEQVSTETVPPVAATLAVSIGGTPHISATEQTHIQCYSDDIRGNMVETQSNTVGIRRDDVSIVTNTDVFPTSNMVDLMIDLPQSNMVDLGEPIRSTPPERKYSAKKAADNSNAKNGFNSDVVQTQSTSSSSATSDPIEYDGSAINNSYHGSSATGIGATGSIEEISPKSRILFSPRRQNAVSVHEGHVSSISFMENPTHRSFMGMENPTHRSGSNSFMESPTHRMLQEKPSPRKEFLMKSQILKAQLKEQALDSIVRETCREIETKTMKEHLERLRQEDKRMQEEKDLLLREKQSLEIEKETLRTKADELKTEAETFKTEAELLKIQKESLLEEKESLRQQMIEERQQKKSELAKLEEEKEGKDQLLAKNMKEMRKKEKILERRRRENFELKQAVTNPNRRKEYLTGQVNSILNNVPDLKSSKLDENSHGKTTRASSIRLDERSNGKRFDRRSISPHKLEGDIIGIRWKAIALDSQSSIRNASGSKSVNIRSPVLRIAERNTSPILRIAGRNTSPALRIADRRFERSDRRSSERAAHDLKTTFSPPVRNSLSSPPFGENGDVAEKPADTAGECTAIWGEASRLVPPKDCSSSVNTGEQSPAVETTECSPAVSNRTASPATLQKRLPSPGMNRGHSSPKASKRTSAASIEADRSASKQEAQQHDDRVSQPKQELPQHERQNVHPQLSKRQVQRDDYISPSKQRAQHLVRQRMAEASVPKGYEKTVAKMKAAALHGMRSRKEKEYGRR